MLRRSLVILVGGLFLIFSAAVAPAARAQEPAAGAAADDVPAVLSIGVVKGRAGTQVTIAGNVELTYEYSVIEGKNLVVDIPGVASRVWPAEQEVDDEFVGRVRVAEHTGERPGVRVVFDLRRPAGFTVQGDQGRILVSFAAEGAAVARARLTRVTSIASVSSTTTYRVRISTDTPPVFRLLPQTDPGIVTVAIERATLDSAAAIRDVPERDALVTAIAAREAASDPPQVVVAMTLRRETPFRVAVEGSGVNVDFTAPAVTAVPSARPAGPATAPDPAGSYTGQKITLDFADADITDIFRLIADVSGVNIVASDDVKGKRTVKMTEVPWDQALELILRTNIPQLVKTLEAGNVLSITTLKRTLEDQAAVEKLRFEQLKRAADEQKQAYENAVTIKRLEAESQSQLLEKIKAERQRSKGWLDRTFTISYGDTKEVAERLKKFSSGCLDGCVFEVGERSKTIFVRDFVDNILQMDEVLRVLEAPTPAVMVEARIVEVQSDYSQALGVQWGASFVADAAHGNATPYAFPNAISVGGTAREGADGVNPGNYLVNLPASNAVAGVGLTLGHIANTLSLDMKLSALERMGKTKILSNPKVLVVQNEEANINVGSQLPVPKTDAEGNRTIDWKDVGILLQVTPNVTSDGRVFMKIKIEKSAAGETVRTTEGEMFSIERRGAVTKVLVGDGETSVIGGIFQQTNTDGNDGVPGLSKLPLVGWLFKSKSALNSRKELMIFLTPRIQVDQRDQSPRTALLAAAQGPGSGLFGSVRVLAAEPAPQGSRVDATVEYVNDTAFTFASSVSVNCKAYAADGAVIGGDVERIWARDHGPLGPGFRLRLDLPLAISGGAYAATRCEAVKAE